MKKLSLYCAFASLTFAVSSSHAQEAPAPAVPAPPVPAPALLDALQSASRELRLYFSPESNPISTLGNFDRFAYTPETAQKLVAVFGSDHPLIVQRLPAVKGKVNFAMRMPAWHFADPACGTVDAGELAMRLEFDKAGRHAAVSGGWPTFDFTDNTATVALRDIRITSRQYKGAGADHLWYGNVRFDIASMRAAFKPGNTVTTFSDIRSVIDVVPRGKLANLKYDIAIKSIGVGEARIEDFHAAFRADKVDMKGLTAISDDMQKHQTPGATPEQQMAAMKVPLHAMARQAIVSGSSFDIDDLSARYHGYLARLKGHIGFAGATAEDGGSIVKLVKKIVAHVDISVPLALYKDVGASMAAKMAKQPTPEHQPADAPASPTPDQITDTVLGQMIGNGYVQLDKGLLRSSIDFADGKLRINGKAITLPAINVQGKPVVLPAPRDGAPGSTSLPPG